MSQSADLLIVEASKLGIDPVNVAVMYDDAFSVEWLIDHDGYDKEAVLPSSGMCIRLWCLDLVLDSQCVQVGHPC